MTDRRGRCRPTPTSGAGPRTGARTPCRDIRTRPSLEEGYPSGRTCRSASVGFGRGRGRTSRADTDFGVDAGGEIVAGTGDSAFGIGPITQIPPPPQPSPLGAGYLILVVRELTGMSQRVLARAIGTSQPTLATLETGNRVPTVRTLLRVADATGFELVIGLRRPNNSAPNPDALRAPGVRSARDAQTEPAGRSRRLRGASRAEPARRPAITPSFSPTREPLSSPRSARPSRPASTGSSRCRRGPVRPRRTVRSPCRSSNA